MSESTSGQVELSVVVPVFNEEESLPHLHAALIPELEALGASDHAHQERVR